jgi:glycosidase
MRFGEELKENEKELLEQSGKLVEMRKKHPALRYGDFLTVKATQDVYAFVRSDLNERILIILNKADKQQKVNLELPDFYTGSYIQDLETSEKVASERGRVSMTIDGWTWRMFELK